MFPLSYFVQPLARLKYIADLVQIHLTFEGIGPKVYIQRFLNVNVIFDIYEGIQRTFVFSNTTSEMFLIKNGVNFIHGGPRHEQYGK